MEGRINCRECGNDTLWNGIRPERCQACAAWFPVEAFRGAKRTWERAYCDHLLRITSGNVSEFARLAQKDRKDCYELLRRCGLVLNDYRPKKTRRQTCPS